MSEVCGLEGEEEGSQLSATDKQVHKSIRVNCAPYQSHCIHIHVYVKAPNCPRPSPSHCNIWCLLKGSRANCISLSHQMCSRLVKHNRALSSRAKRGLCLTAQDFCIMLKHHYDYIFLSQSQPPKEHVIQHYKILIHYIKSKFTAYFKHLAQRGFIQLKNNSLLVRKRHKV